MNSLVNDEARYRGGRKRRQPKLPPFWRSLRFRGLVYELAALGFVLVVGVYMASNAAHAMAARGIHSGFGFLFRQAGFAIGESLVPFDSADSFLRAFGVGLSNTLFVSAVGIVGATVLGTLLGLARLSSNWLLARIASVYIELFRNTPQLVQIVLWYTLITHLPGARDAWHLSDWLYFSNRGLVTAWPANALVPTWISVALFAIFAVGAVWALRANSRRRASRHAPTASRISALIVFGAPVAAWVIAGAPSAMDFPELGAFNFHGGITFSSEFIALALGLSLYIAAYIAEIFRSGIQSVSRGQIEAGRAIGLRGFALYRWVILPHALRVIVPPITAQYISLVKTSALGVAVGYPELFNVTNSIITLSGHTIECVLIMGATYLAIALGMAAVMNAYNKSIAISEH